MVCGITGLSSLPTSLSSLILQWSGLTQLGVRACALGMVLTCFVFMGFFGLFCLGATAGDPHDTFLEILGNQEMSEMEPAPHLKICAPTR